jgi:hypothetical protein
MDNFYGVCPAEMSDGRLFTDYRTSTAREQYTKYINNIKTEHQYREFLQQNGKTIINNEYEYNKKNYQCNPNICVHNYTTVTTPGKHNEEMKIYNAIGTGKLDPSLLKCPKLDDYRLN